MIYQCISCGEYYSDTAGMKDDYPPLKGDIAIPILQRPVLCKSVNYHRTGLDKETSICFHRIYFENKV